VLRLKCLTVGRALPFLVQDRRPLSVVMPLGIEVAHPIVDLLPIDMLAVAHALSHDLLFTTGPSVPVDLTPDLPVHSCAIHDDMLDHQTPQICTIGMGGGGCMPDAGESFANREHLLALLRGHRRVRLAFPLLVRLLGALHVAQLDFPLTLQRAHPEPMLGLHRILPTLSPLGCIAGTLEAKLPLSLQGFPRQPSLLQSLQGERKALRHKGLKHKTLDRGSNPWASHCLAILSPVLLGLSTTAVARGLSWRPSVPESHATRTATADDHPLQHGCPATRSPLPTWSTSMAVVTEPMCVFQKPLPTHIGGRDPLQAHRPLLDRQAHDPTTTSTRSAARPICDMGHRRKLPQTRGGAGCVKWRWLGAGATLSHAVPAPGPDAREASGSSGPERSAQLARYRVRHTAHR
jgi:hypothetical protein